MKIYGEAEAAENLDAILDEVLAGEEIYIGEAGHLRAKIIP